MQNKRLILLISLVLVFLTVCCVLIFQYWPDRQNQQLSEKQNIERIDFGTAVISKNPDNCDALPANEDVDACKQGIIDIIGYENALMSLDVADCATIQDQVKKDACYSMLKDGEEYLVENNPKHLADLRSKAHSEEAIGLYEKIVVSDKKDEDSLIRLSFAYSEKALAEYQRGNKHNGYIDLALDAANKAILLSGSSSDAYRARGYAYEILPDFSSARVAYDRAIEVGPDSPMAYASKGHLSRVEGMLEEALALFEKAASLDPEMRIDYIYVNLCGLEFSRSRLDQAEKYCRIVSEKQSAARDVLYVLESFQNLASIYVHKREYDNARQSITRAMEMDAENPQTLFIFSQISLDLGEYSDAERYAKSAIAKLPSKTLPYIALSRALYAQKQYKPAIEAAANGLSKIEKDASLLFSSKSPAKRDLYQSLSDSYSALGDKQKAEDYLKKAKEVYEN